MAQCTVIRMSLADLRGMSTPNPEAPAPAPNTLYYVIQSRVLRDNLAFGVTPFPMRSLVEARNRISRIHPRARSFMAEAGNPGFVHIARKENTGEEVITKIVKEHNPAVLATSQDTPLYLIIHREMWFLASPPYDKSDLGGTFLSQDEANAVAHRIFQQKVGDNHVLKAQRKDDGCLECEAGHPDPDREGYLWQVEVNRIGWNAL
ncbi:MAG: hypothetical protein L6R42_005293 [Xanthoria sp. 1 TBL-2021]|nr:MAG: hypothetical protein L6R42_005293 [Xanthoria sp. 1 TBL-2021]